MFLFLDLEPNDYSFFTGDYYSSGDLEDVKQGLLAIIDLVQMALLLIDEKGVVSWSPIEKSVVRSNEVSKEKFRLKNQVGNSLLISKTTKGELITCPPLQRASMV